MGLFSRRVKVGPLPPKANPYPSRLRKLRRPSALLVAVTLLLSFYILSWVHPVLHKKLESHLVEGALTLGTWITHPFYVAQSFYEDSEKHMRLAHENDRLRHENDDLKTLLLSQASTILENRELRKYLNIPSPAEFTVITTSVIATPQDGLHHACIVEGGESAGLHVNQAVIAPQGVVGRVYKTTAHTARVLLITDYQSKTPVMIPRLQQNAIAMGDGSPTPLLTYLENATLMEDGDDVFTSGLGGIYPRGLYVGKVTKTSAGKILLIPAASVSTLSHVQVIQNPFAPTHELNASEDIE